MSDAIEWVELSAPTMAEAKADAVAELNRRGGLPDFIEAKRRPGVCIVRLGFRQPERDAAEARP